MQMTSHTRLSYYIGCVCVCSKGWNGSRQTLLFTQFVQNVYFVFLRKGLFSHLLLTKAVFSSTYITFSKICRTQSIINKQYLYNKYRISIVSNQMCISILTTFATQVSGGSPFCMAPANAHAQLTC